MKKTPLVLSLVSLFALVGCDTVTTSSDESSSAVVLPEVVDLSSAIQYLGLAPFSARISSGPASNPANRTHYEVYYGSDYFWSDFDQVGYAEKDGAVFRVMPDNEGNIRGSEAFEDATSLRDSGLFPLVNGIDLSRETISEDGQSATLANKANQLVALRLLGRDASELLSISEGSISMTGDDITTFQISLTIGSRLYTFSVRTDGISSGYAPVETYLENNGAYTPTWSETELRNLFFADNYKRDVLDPNDPSISYGTEYFMPGYFVGLYNDAGHAQLAFDQAYASFQNLHIQVPDTDENGNPTVYDTVLDGTYLFTPQSDGTYQPNLAYPYITTNNLTDRSSGLGYIKHAHLWDYLEFLDEQEDGTFIIENEEIATDFDELNGSMITSSGYSPTSVVIDYDWGEGDVVNFDIHFTYLEEDFSIRFSFFDFGKASISAMEERIEWVKGFAV